MGRIYAGTLGLVAFLTIVARGLINNGSGGNTVLYAAGAMFIFATIGWIAGTIAEMTVDQAVRRQFDLEVETSQEDVAPT